MTVIPVRVCGDAWSNPEEVHSLLYQTDKNDQIVLDFYAEGASIGAIGLLKILDDFCHHADRDANTITIINNPNVTEKTPYKNLTSTYNHMLILVKNYWQDPVTSALTAKKFGYFVGRKTIARSFMLYDLYHNFGQDFVFSSMKNRGPAPWVKAPEGINLEQVSDWMDEQQFQDFRAWFENCPVASLDGASVIDQFVPSNNTNRDLLSYYDKFLIELVAETYTVGDTFFPTEKTFRPMVAAKPLLIYGPKNFLQRLQHMGFETWSSCWDESYDQLEGFSRWQAMRQLLDHIVIDSRAQEIALRNRQHLRKVVYDRTFV